MGEHEMQYLRAAYQSNWIAPLGPFVDGFESDLENYLGEEVHAAALSSGTSAIHLALILSGVGTDDYVICQSMTFAASANPIRYVGGIPVFVDSETDTWNMDPVQLEKAILWCISKGKKPKAIIPVHLYGMPAKMKRICEIAKSYDIKVIEDAAEALGSHIDGRKCGTWGDFGILSFNGNKIITTSGGGALISKDAEAISRARYLATQAKDPGAHYQHSVVGYNYRLSNICAAIGRGQMEVLDAHILQHRRNFQKYLYAFADIPQIYFQHELKNYHSNRWLTSIFIDASVGFGKSRFSLYNHLQEQNIESRPVWKPLHMQPVFESYPFFGNELAVSEQIFDQGLCLPSGSNLTDAQIDFVIDEIKEHFAL
jgi:dTDP-4-amino-4,6-dideoxygalactose transaminase